MSFHAAVGFVCVLLLEAVPACLPGKDIEASGGLTLTPLQKIIKKIGKLNHMINELGWRLQNVVNEHGGRGDVSRPGDSL